MNFDHKKAAKKVLTKASKLYMSSYKIRYMGWHMSKPSTSKDALHVKAYQEITNNTICLRPEPGEKISEDETAKYLEIRRTLVRESL